MMHWDYGIFQLKDTGTGDQCRKSCWYCHYSVVEPEYWRIALENARSYEECTYKATFDLDLAAEKSHP